MAFGFLMAARVPSGTPWSMASLMAITAACTESLQQKIMQFFWVQIHVKQIVITVLLNSWLYKLSLVVYVYKGRSCAKEPRGIQLQKQKHYSQAASSTDSSFAKIPPILLNAGI